VDKLYTSDSPENTLVAPIVCSLTLSLSTRSPAAFIDASTLSSYDQKPQEHEIDIVITRAMRVFNFYAKLDIQDGSFSRILKRQYVRMHTKCNGQHMQKILVTGSHFQVAAGWFCGPMTLRVQAASIPQ